MAVSPIKVKSFAGFHKVQYMADLPNCPKTTTQCLYTNDTQIFTSSRDSVELANDINSDLVNVTDWLNVNKLKSHPSKVKLMAIGFKQNLTNNVGDLYSSIIMNNNVIWSVVSNKCLGVDLDDRLAFHINIEEICKRICSGIGTLRRIKPFIPQSSLNCYIYAYHWFNHIFIIALPCGIHVIK